MSRFWTFSLVSLIASSACDGASSRSADGAPAPGDAGASLSDAAAEIDADPSCRSWRRVQVPVVGATLLEERPVRVDRSARFRVEIEQCPGDEPGLWELAPTLENEYLTVSATAWRSGPDCVVPEEVVRYITATFPYPGDWTVSISSDAPVVHVEPAAGGECGSAPESACERDCDCPPGERCLSGSTPEGSVQRCARPCEFDRECQGGVCGEVNGLSRVCSSGGDECGAQDDCPAGFECQEGICAPTFVLNSSTRHECSCDADCDSGLRCVTVGYGEQETTSCQVTCPTRSSGWCQGAHVCDSSASVEPYQGICGWVGE